MKTSSILVILSAVLFGATPMVAADTGAIEGRVRHAVTGQSLNNARITVAGTSRLVFSDQAGSFQLPQLPAGPAVVEITYMGLDHFRQEVNVRAGQTEKLEVRLTNTSLYGDKDVVQLDSFVVTTARVTDVATLAVNEQRYAPNIKNVVAGDAFGDVLDGNVGEFLKFLPGVSAEYDFEGGGAAAGISVRGFSSNLTMVTADGAQLANSGPATGDSRSYHFGSISMNNVSRVELTKVPTPATPADSMAGSVNMISKSAFERRRAALNYTLNLSADSRFLSFKPQPSQSDQLRRKARPGGNFDYTLPVNDRFGLVVTGAYSERYFLSTGNDPKNYNSNATGTTATPAAPFMQNWRMTQHERFDERWSGGLRADWKVIPHGVLSVSGQTSTFRPDRDPYDIIWNVGTNGTPTPATGVPLTYGPTFTSGATGRGAVTMQSTAGVDQYADTHAGASRFKFDNGTWRVDTGYNYSRGKSTYHDLSHRQFRQFGIAMAVPVRVVFSGISPDQQQPAVMQVLDNNNREVDLTDVRNWRVNTANSTPRSTIDIQRGGDASVRRLFEFRHIPVAVQAGVSNQEQVRDARHQSNNWTYNGLNGDFSPAPFLNSVYNQTVRGFANIPWASRRKAYEEWQKNPGLFTQTPAQVVTNETNRINNSKYIAELKRAGYVQWEARVLENRLTLLTGVRYEYTQVRGEGVLFEPAAVFQRAADGTFLRTSAGARIRRSDAGAAGSLEELKLIRGERAYEAQRSYDGYYPSLHANYELKKDLVSRFAYARTFGRPNFSQIIPNASVNEADLDAATADPTVLRGRLTVTNIALKPWTADNYDLSLEYYTLKGGLLSAGVFYKDIKDFFGTAVSVATAADVAQLDLDPRYAGWELTRTINAGSARVSGVELNVMHPLADLGPWGKPFRVFVAGAALDLEGGNLADFSNFTRRTANWGVTYNQKPFTIQAKWNYRGNRQVTPVAALGTNGYEYQRAQTRMDLTCEAQLSRRLRAFVNVNNVFNGLEISERYADETPSYARLYGIIDHGRTIFAGIKGSF